jgi:pyruvate-formate lyase-activating enzyme
MAYSAGFLGQCQKNERISRLLWEIKKSGPVIHILGGCQMRCPACSNLPGIVHL